MTIRIINADVMDGLRQMPDESVHCVVTSPPYWGLRDYGTGRWEGGDDACDHRSPTMRDGRNEDRAKLAGSVATNMAQLLTAHSAPCGKCGAVKVDRQLGLERTYQEHVDAVVAVFREVRRVLRSDGTLWLNYGDSYATSVNGRSAADTKAVGNDDRTFRDKPFSTIQGVLKPKDLCGIPWRVAFALQADGWWLRSDIIWAKPNPMPESVTDRPTKSHEYVFLLTKAERYYYDAEAIKEAAVADHPSGNGFKRDARLTYQNGDGSARGNDKQWIDVGGSRNKRSVWTVATAPFSEAHFATFPPDLIEPMIKAGTSQHGCCAKCGAPWERVIDVESRPNAPPCNGKYDGIGKHRTVAGGVSNDARARVDMGWHPTCECSATVIPCTVLDPFSGAGTTCLVADRLQRNAIGIELNPEYAAMSEARINKDRGGLLDLMEAAE